MMPRITQGEQQADGAILADALALTVDHGVSVLSSFAGRRVDEMSFDSFLGNWALVSNFTLNSTDSGGIGALKYAAYCSPSSMYYTPQSNCISAFSVYNTGTIPAGTGYAIAPSPACYLANIFCSWKGCFKFRFTAAKTKFHAGRLMIAYNPINNGILNGKVNSVQSTAANVPSSPSTIAFQSAIWDLRSSSVFEFEVPYISQDPYIGVENYACGLFVWVLDPLVGPSNVSTTVPVAVEMCCMPGFEFAIPSVPRLKPAPPTGTTYMAQADIDADYCTTRPNESALCIGESIRSLRSLAIRATPYMLASAAFNASQIFPWYYATPGQWLNGVVVNSRDSTTFWCSSLDNTTEYLASCFAYVRGGCRFYAPSTNLGPSKFLSNWNNNGVSEIDTTYNGCPTAYFNGTASNQGAVSIPMYCNHTKRLMFAVSAPGAHDASGLFAITNFANNNSGNLVYASAADDVQMGFFLGCPPLAIPYQSTPLSNLYQAMGTYSGIA
jgi:hypothetical protein